LLCWALLDQGLNSTRRAQKFPYSPFAYASLQYVCFSNRPVGVKRFQALQYSVGNVARGLVLLYGLGTSARPSWDSKTRWNDLLGGLAVGRSKQTCELTSSIVPPGTSFHRLVELEFPPIAFDPQRRLRRRSSSGPSEFSAINPDAMHNHGQPSSQGNDCLLHPAVPGDLHRPGLEPRPFCRT